MKIVYFTHSIRSCWNHGNAHFVRGILRELARRGHDVLAMEATGAWSVSNLLADHGIEGLKASFDAYSDLRASQYLSVPEALLACDGADLVVVHEWNDPELVAAIGDWRKREGHFTLLFHDTHHRAVSDPAAIRTFDLDGYDGILAFGEALAAVYRRWGWGRRAYVWHEAADTSQFRPPVDQRDRNGVVWIGNWGDGERTQEIETFLLAPAAASALPLDIYGVRYPSDALAMLARYAAYYHGWLPNAAAPSIFAGRLATVHVPRRYYAEHLPGIPTIRVFEALACGIPLVSAPWHDAEGLFRPGRDFLIAKDGISAAAHLRALHHDPELRAALSDSGLETIRARHTCAHRVDQLLAIVSAIGAPAEATAGPAA